jgi:hypothetical protein
VQAGPDSTFRKCFFNGVQTVRGILGRGRHNFSPGPTYSRRLSS